LCLLKFHTQITCTWEGEEEPSGSVAGGIPFRRGLGRALLALLYYAQARVLRGDGGGARLAFSRCWIAAMTSKQQ
jgi:hypothetical protein